MKRKQVSWSNFTDTVEGPCVVCQKEVHIVIPSDRPDPAVLYHATCDPIATIRTNLKTGTPPPLLSSEYKLSKLKPA